MLINLLALLLFILVTALFIWLFVRSLHSRRPVVKWLGMFFSGLFGLLSGALTVLMVLGFFQVYLPAAPAVTDFQASTDPAQIARGEHLAAYVCAGCHTNNEQLPLSGGSDFGADIPIPLGSFPAYNLTPGGPLKDWKDGEIYRAIRYGVDKDGRKLVFMSVAGVQHIGQADIEAIVAYLRSQPAVETPPVREQVGPLGLIVVASGLLPSSSPAQTVVTPPIAPTAEYGEYLVGFSGCKDCHGERLGGGAGGFAPQGPSLVAVVPGWSQEQFIAVFRTGKTPEGRILDNEVMPWKSYSVLDETELAAIYSYINSLK